MNTLERAETANNFETCGNRQYETTEIHHLLGCVFMFAYILTVSSLTYICFNDFLSSENKQCQIGKYCKSFIK